MVNTDKKIQELIDLGLATSIEEAQSILSNSGAMAISGGAYPFAIEGMPELKLFSGHSKSTFTAYNRAVKSAKAKLDMAEEGFYYLGSNFVKDKEGKLDLTASTIGIPLGNSVEVIVVGYLYFLSRYIPQGKANITTTLSKSLSKDAQSKMIDRNSGRTALDIKNELREKYPDGKVLEAEKATFQHYTVLLVKTEDGWTPCYHITKVNMGDRDFWYQYQLDVIEGGLLSTQVAFTLISFESEDCYSGKCGSSRKLLKDEIMQIVPIFRETNKQISVLMEKQAAYIKEKFGNGGTVIDSSSDDASFLD